MDSLDQYAIPSFKGLVNECHTGGESVRHKIGLSVRPRQLQVVHARSSAGNMGWVIGGAGVRRELQVGVGCDGAQRM